jgi:hypothetical protein
MRRGVDRTHPADPEQAIEAPLAIEHRAHSKSCAAFDLFVQIF